MREALAKLVDQALATLHEAGTLGGADPRPAVIEHPREPEHGDFASPVALSLARAARRSPRAIADAIIEALPKNRLVERAEVAGPGFINFYLYPDAYHSTVRTILDAGRDYGRSEKHTGERVQVEFVSANPTGPLHVGHGRGAAYGAVVADLLAAVGYGVEREYYVNDAGRQMDILAASVWLRYLELRGTAKASEFPANAYQGEYIRTIAAALADEHGAAYEAPPPSPTTGPADEAALDRLIEGTKTTLGPGYRVVAEFGLQAILSDIEADLEAFGIRYDRWYSERSLTVGDALARSLARLEENGHAYRRDGAVWFRSTDFGDEKDRVLVRENGQSTYFASDIAYHLDKLERGYGRLIDVWGADHHGYIARVKGALAGLGQDPDRLSVLLVQFANLLRGGEKVAMSTRSGQFVTLRELREEVGNDAARFFYVMRKSDQHLDFDLDLAKSRSNDNPVYYIQYAHARVCSVERQLAAKGLSWDKDSALESVASLTEPHELALLKTLARFPEVIENAAASYEPHQLAFYLRDASNEFHTYYNAHTFLVDDARLRGARVALAIATRVVLRNGLALLGVSAPESM